jgi:hypothetical protein
MNNIFGGIKNRGKIRYNASIQEDAAILHMKKMVILERKKGNF